LSALIVSHLIGINLVILRIKNRDNKMEFRLSPSALNLMKECPRCFWLAQHKVWKRPAGIFPSLPSGMDKILKIHFDKFRDKGQLPPELCENGECQNL